MVDQEKGVEKTSFSAFGFLLSFKGGAIIILTFAKGGQYVWCVERNGSRYVLPI